MFLRVGVYGVLIQKILFCSWLQSVIIFKHMIPQQSVPWHYKQHIIPSLSKHNLIENREQPELEEYIFQQEATKYVVIILQKLISEIKEGYILKKVTLTEFRNA